MESFLRWLERVFARGGEIEGSLSEHWRRHTNRRTIIIALVAGACAAYLYINIIQPPDTFPTGTLVSIPEGASLSEASISLEELGVVRSGFALKVLVTLSGNSRDVHAGDYLFKEPASLFSVARAISIGAYGLEPVRVRIPEGATTKRMATILSAAHLQRFDPADFLAKAQPQEGYLFPDTYFFLPNTTAATVIKAMRQNFDTQIATIAPQLASSTSSLSDIVIMASILEREAYNTADRRMIAGVLWNRLSKGMPLQVDVTFLYTIGKGTFQLTMADLTSDSPYNTYKHKGLPPTPIGSPSLDSLLAAAVPTKNDYLYFLADRRGVTHYCKNYACQVANKAKYF